jgi:hypothetical protein
VSKKSGAEMSSSHKAAYLAAPYMEQLERSGCRWRDKRPFLEKRENKMLELLEKIFTIKSSFFWLGIILMLQWIYNTVTIKKIRLEDITVKKIRARWINLTIITLYLVIGFIMSHT